MEPSATIAHVEQFYAAHAKGECVRVLLHLTSSACFLYNAFSHTTTAGMRPLHTLRYRRAGALGPHEPSSVLSYGKETEHGSTSPYA